MRAIDRATRWGHMLEDAGFTVEVTTIAMLGSEYREFKATLGKRIVWFNINVGSPRTRFGTGGHSFCGSARHTAEMGAMAQMIFSEIELLNYMRSQNGINSTI